MLTTRRCQPAKAPDGNTIDYAGNIVVLTPGNDATGVRSGSEPSGNKTMERFDKDDA